MSAAVSRRELKFLSDVAQLVSLAGRAQIVPIGEASHGTHDFYATRAQLTQQLITNHVSELFLWKRIGPTCCGRIAMSRVVPKSARRFPPVSGLDVVQQVMVEFVDWLRQWNLARAEEDRAGLFGLDLYSMHPSIESVLGYLDKTDPDAARETALQLP